MVTLHPKLKSYLKDKGVLDMAIKNTKDYTQGYVYKHLESLFPWAGTDQGFQFWDKIADGCLMLY